MSKYQLEVEKHLDIADGLTVEIIKWSTPPHWISSYEASSHLFCRRLSPMQRFYGWVRVGGSEHGMDLGQTRFMPADIPVRWELDAHDSVRTLLCWMSPERFQALTSLADQWDRLLLSRCYDLRLPMVDEAMLRLASEIYAPGFATSLVSESLANLVVGYVVRALQACPVKPAKQTGGLAHWQLKRITEYVEDSNDPRPTLGKLASLCGISRGHLTRAFKQTTGTTVHSYVEQVRLRRALVLLKENRLSIKQIASQLGFTSQCSFAQAFSRLTGVSPSQYRRRLN
jgi:AraC family transcriptional regulator